MSGERVLGIAAIAVGVVAVVIAVIDPCDDVVAIGLGAALASWGSFRLLAPSESGRFSFQPPGIHCRMAVEPLQSRGARWLATRGA